MLSLSLSLSLSCVRSSPNALSRATHPPQPPLSSLPGDCYYRTGSISLSSFFCRQLVMCHMSDCVVGRRVAATRAMKPSRKILCRRAHQARRLLYKRPLAHPFDLSRMTRSLDFFSRLTLPHVEKGVSFANLLTGIPKNRPSQSQQVFRFYIIAAGS